MKLLLVTDTKFNYWAVDSDYAFPVNSFFRDIKTATDTETLKKIGQTFREEGMAIKKYSSKARLMSDFIDITVSTDTLDEKKLETFLISVLRSQRRDIANYESEPSVFKKIVKRLFRK